MPPPEQTPTEEIDALQRAIQHLHGCGSNWVRSITTADALVATGEVAWVRTVELFALQGYHNWNVNKCYAWSEPIEGTTQRRYFAVLHDGPIEDAGDAVRASIYQDAKQGPR